MELCLYILYFQDFENIQSYQAKEKVNTLGVTISIQRQHKVVQNKVSLQEI